MTSTRCSIRPRKATTQTIISLHGQGLCVREIHEQTGIDKVHIRSCITNYGLVIHRDPQHRYRGANKSIAGLDARILSGEVDRMATVWGAVSRGFTVEQAAEMAGCDLDEAKRLADQCPKGWLKCQ